MRLTLTLLSCILLAGCPLMDAEECPPCPCGDVAAVEEPAALEEAPAATEEEVAPAEDVESAPEGE